MINNNKYGRLTVIEETTGRIPKRKYYKCLCECGNIHTVMGKYLRNGDVKSCGCLHKEQLSKRQKKHGESLNGQTTEYRTWKGIHSRCYNTNNAKYYRYGGRGIKVCERWHEYENFLADMGRKPSPELSIDRVNNDGDYCPENCRWATVEQQQSNKDTTSFRGHNNQHSRLTEDDVKKIRHRLELGDALKSIALDFNVSYNAIYKIRNGITWKWL